MIEKIINYNTLHWLVILPTDWLAAGQLKMSNEKVYILHCGAGKMINLFGCGWPLNLCYETIAKLSQGDVMEWTFLLQVGST